MNVLRLNRKILLFVIITAFSMSAYGQSVNSNVGTSAFSFLKIKVSARSVAMGGAFTGLADDESALYYNPAGLTVFEQNRFILDYHNYFYDMQSGFIGFIKPLNSKSVLGFSINYLNYGDFTETTEQGDVTGEFSGGDLLFAVSLAMKQNYQFSYAATAKLIYEKIQDYSASGVAVDLALKYTADRGRFGGGLMLQNIGKQLSSLGNEKYDLPAAIRGGAFYMPRGLPLLLTSDIAVPFDNDLVFAIGGEYFEFKPFYIRLGWNSFGSNYRTADSEDSWAGLSFGAGFDYNKMQLSYAYSPSAELGDSHRITIVGEI